MFEPVAFGDREDTLVQVNWNPSGTRIFYLRTLGRTPGLSYLKFHAGYSSSLLLP